MLFFLQLKLKRGLELGHKKKRKKLQYYWSLSQNDLDVPDDAHSSGITFLL